MAGRCNAVSIIQIVSQILVRLSDAIGIVQRVLSTLITSGWYIVVQDAATVTGDIHGLLEDPTCGQEAQCTKLNSLITTTDDIVTLLNDLSTLVGGGRVVNLPTTPPAGYGGASAGDTADAVWNHANYAGYAMGDTMRSLVYFFDGMNANLAWPSPSGGPFVISANVGAFNAEPWGHNPDYGLDSILVTDATVGDWLNRVAGWGETWSLDPDSLYWRTFGLGNPANNTSWYCTLSEVQFAWIKAQLAGTTVLVPPIWPGIANVTLGTAVPFSGSTLSVAGPMDGVIVTITSVNQPLPHYSYGTAVAWGKLGGLTFVDDNGDAEEYQLFGFVDAIYCPRSMVQADSCQIRNVSGIVGTVTPWTKS